MLIGVAIDIPEPWRAELTRRRMAAGDAVAAEIPAHLTLLGPTEVDAPRLPDIETHLAAVAKGQPPFPLHLSGTGTFRPITDVVFVAITSGSSECHRLAAEINEAPGLQREPRFPYHPHVTVAQDLPRNALDTVYQDLAGFDAMFTVDGFTLFEHEDETGWRARLEFGLGRGSGRDPR